MTLELGIFLALGCAFATNLGFLYKYRGACAAASVDIRHPLRSAKCLFSSRWFAIGMLVAVGAWILHVVGKHIGGPAEHHGVMLGAASGVLFGVSDIAIKALTGLVGSGPTAGSLIGWVLVALAASVAAFYASARGLQDGEAVPVIATTATAANVASIAGGIVVFGDPLPGNVLGLGIQMAAFAIICVAAFLTPAPVRAANGRVAAQAA